MVYYSAASAVTIVFDLRSVARYKRLTASAKEKYRSDFLLLGKERVRISIVFCQIRL